jgi:endonuclease/exonuclease/phosphatase family metal-dependent hydrolase
MTTSGNAAKHGAGPAGLASRFRLWRHGLARQRHSGPGELPGDRLRLLSFNIQAGIGTTGFHQYLTHSWRHLVAHRGSVPNLDRIAEVVRDYDVVALQEVDAGSLRSGFVNQLRHLADRADFPYWHEQVNRNLGRFGQFSNGVLSRVSPWRIEDHRLPGPPGRGAIIARYGNREHPLVVVNLHLALGERVRNRQLDYLCTHLDDARHLIIMGDFNLPAERLRHSPLGRMGLQDICEPLMTYPSWRPDRHIDHILVSPSLRVERVQALDVVLSDHRPVAMDVRLPAEVLGLPERLRP